MVENGPVPSILDILSLSSFFQLQTQGQFPYWSSRHRLPFPSSAVSLFLPFPLSLHLSCSPPLASILFLFFSFLLFLLPCCLCLLSSIHLTHKGSWASGRELKSSEKRLFSTAGHMKPVPESSRLDKGSTPQSGKK